MRTELHKEGFVNQFIIRVISIMRCECHVSISYFQDKALHTYSDERDGILWNKKG